VWWGGESVAVTTGGVRGVEVKDGGETNEEEEAKANRRVMGGRHVRKKTTSKFTW
jgi:hypothetical protein